MKHLSGETQEDIEDRVLFHAPPIPPVFCPSCERESCLLWKAERHRRMQERACRHRKGDGGEAMKGTETKGLTS